MLRGRQVNSGWNPMSSPVLFLLAFVFGSIGDGFRRISGRR